MLNVRAAILCSVLTLAVSVVFAQAASQPPAPSGRNEQRIEPAASSQPSDGRGPLKSDIPPPIQSGASVKQEASETEKRAESKDAANKWWLHADWPVAFITGVLALITWRLVVYTKKLWGATKKVADDAKDATERGQRAYINIDKVFAVWHADKEDRFRPITITVNFKNSGKTPAHRVTSWMGTASAASENIEFRTPEADPNESIGVQGPGQIGHLSKTRTIQLDAESEIAVWESGKQSLYVWGQIDYVDAFKERRWTKFRFVMPKEGMHETGGKFRPCRHGNEAS